jgi:hypothetical protein
MHPLQHLAVIVFGWPAALASLLLVAVGLAARKFRLVIVGVIVGTPFLLYFALTPRFRYVAALILLLNYASAVAAHREKVVVASVLYAPYVIFLMLVPRMARVLTG